MTKTKSDISSEVSRIAFLRSYLIKDMGWEPEGVYGLTLGEMEMAYRLLNTTTVTAQEKLMVMLTTYEERIAYIKSIAERQARMRKLKEKARFAMRWAEEEERPRRKNLTAQYDSGESEIHYTDASKYAKQYYGDVAYHTTKFDNDWD